MAAATPRASRLVLRPRSAIEIVDLAFSLWRRHFVPMSIIGLAASLPVVVLGILGIEVMDGLVSGSSTVDAVTPFVLVGLVVGLFWIALVDGAMTFAAGDAYFGRTVTPGRAIKGAIGRGGALVLGNILRVLAVGAVGAAAMGVGVFSARLGGGVFAILFAIVAILAALLVFARLFATTSVIVFEHSSATGSLRRSLALSRSSVARILGIVLLSWIIVWAAQMVIGLTLQVVLAVIVRNPILVAVVGNLIGMVLYPFLSIALMVLYYDQRIRNEGYDIELMTDGLAPAASG